MARAFFKINAIFLSVFPIRLLAEFKLKLFSLWNICDSFLGFAVCQTACQTVLIYSDEDGFQRLRQFQSLSSEAWRRAHPRLRPQAHSESLRK
jgi:hypothetical protein